MNQTHKRLTLCFNTAAASREISTNSKLTQQKLTILGKKQTNKKTATRLQKVGTEPYSPGAASPTLTTV